MANGIIKTEYGYFVKDFDTNEVKYNIGNPKFNSYMEAVNECRGKFYPESYYQYLEKAARLEELNADVWENMIYAEDYRGVWDGERKEYRDVSTMNRGAATDEELAYVDALDATYNSLKGMVVA